jgi:conserved oligomeric Golgi complex subunit 6
MSGAESQGSVTTAPPVDTVSGPADPSSQAASEAPHGEHEVAKPTEDTNVANSTTLAEQNGNRKTNGMEHLKLDEALGVNDAGDPLAGGGKKAEPPSSEKPKPAMSVKTTGNKLAGPPTPLVKKVSPAVCQILPLF